MASISTLIPTASPASSTRYTSSLSPITRDSEMSDFREYAFVSLGANLPSRFGDPAATLKAATARLQGLSAEPLLLSSLWASAPVDCPPDSPTYVNAVAGLLPAPGVDAR